MIYETEWEYARYVALSSRVLAVANVNKQIGDWSAYIDAVPGQNHDEEFMMVSRRGNKLSFEIAKILFSEEAGKYKWRD
jgi:hypothetical protein